MTSLKHIHQLESWDCGLTCALIILLFAEQENNNDNLDSVNFNYYDDSTIETKLRNISAPFLHSKSVWTVDVALLLAHQDIRINLYTSFSSNVNPALEDLDFYKDSFKQDYIRVPILYKELFKLMEKDEDYIPPYLILLEDLKKNLTSKFAFYLVLVDARLLECLTCSHYVTRNSFDGHYIILTHYDSLNDIFEYLNPANSHSCCSMKSSTLEQARFELGTDNDVIEVILPIHSKKLK
jgi:hypothetical protein